MLGACNLLLSLLLLGGVWIALPGRWLPVDLGGTALALLFGVSGVGLLAGRVWGRTCALVAGAVGLVWIDISKEHYGLHGTPEPSTIGRTESHGCVRLTNWDALRLSSLVKPGTPVIFEP